MSEQAASQLRIELREVLDEDLPIFFGYLQDPHAQSMAASTFEDYADTQAFTSFWAKLRRNDEAAVRTITIGDGPDDVAGHISVAPTDEGLQVRYWIDRPLWGRGIATAALRTMLEEVEERPIFAHISRANERGAAVLLRNDFNLIGEETGFDSSKGRMIDELIYRLG
ncbi:MAG TPA: GNAT family protein [Beutenbergiaceae bacterium]|nr:GNAT family protein [Beutenbergiaceae bacterium]